jgi:prevent-host-death family protein
MDNTSLGIEQARAALPSLVSEAQGGRSRVITKHGKPVAMLVPVALAARAMKPARRAASLTQLRGSGRGLWGRNVGRAVAALRDEWR